MGQIKWYKRYPKDALNGFMGLTLEERGAYCTVLELIYERDGDLPDDDKFIAGWLMVDVRIWRRIKARLIDLGKLQIIAGQVRNEKADTEVGMALSRVGSARDAGLASAHSKVAKSKVNASENSQLAATPVSTPASTPVSTNQNQNQKEEKEGIVDRESPSSPREEDSAAAIRVVVDNVVDRHGRPYAFAGRVIRLTEADLAKWQQLFHAIPDLNSELYTLDLWMSDQGEAMRAKWFNAAAGMLKKTHQEALRLAAQQKAERDRYGEIW